MYDDHVVQVETVSAELTITQPQEIALYGEVFRQLSEQSVYDKRAHALVKRAQVQLDIQSADRSSADDVN